jgi:ABC-type bacteriocin/lantibiotic exporter with double-glycine peptidase domain
MSKLRESSFIFGYYKKYKGLMVLSVISATIVVLSVLPYPLIFKYFIDTVIPKKEVKS